MPSLLIAVISTVPVVGVLDQPEAGRSFPSAVTSISEAIVPLPVFAQLVGLLVASSVSSPVIVVSLSATQANSTGQDHRYACDRALRDKAVANDTGVIVRRIAMQCKPIVQSSGR